jgi:hypothetical protein
MSFENYLLELGYKKQVYDFKTKTLIDAKEFDILSTMGHICFFYIKGNHEIIWGLHEIHKPPTLISPRPEHILNDDEMNRFILSHTNEELYNLIK